MTSNVIAPGAIGGTEGMDRLMRSDDKAEAIRNIPMQRLGSVKDIADATVYLFGETGRYVNGAYIDVDGAAWRIKGSNPGSALKYPDFLLSKDTVRGVKGVKAKL
jgi:peroxisomal 2,4-dienoyl-CoA reductase